MFDIGFWEITVIAVVALLVVGPKEFPALVRTIGTWMGRMRSFFNDFREELDREVSRADELKRLAERESRIAELHEVIDEGRQTISTGRPPGRPGPKGDDADGAEHPADADGRESTEPSGHEHNGRTP